MSDQLMANYSLFDISESEPLDKKTAYVVFKGHQRRRFWYLLLSFFVAYRVQAVQIG